ncbi:MAG: 2OG-Fe(II) oxygenase [Actinomycetia bacterium]|nr:2OG-Fe(II) oxygenase [Actinomycetes bacterium]
MTTHHIDTGRAPIAEEAFRASCRARLESVGALVVSGFFAADTIAQLVEESAPQESDAFFAGSTHNVYLTPVDADLPADHPFNRQVASTKGLIADDQIPARSALRDVYEDPDFRAFLCSVLGIDEIHPYADDVSSINVHFAPHGRELGWHFDNSSFAVTMLLQAPDAGGLFEYVPAARDSTAGNPAYERVAEILDGRTPVEVLRFVPGDLVLFRGRDALHRVTPTEGPTTRMLVVFAFNDQPGVKLSESALATFYGRAR